MHRVFGDNDAQRTQQGHEGEEIEEGHGSNSNFQLENR